MPAISLRYSAVVAKVESSYGVDPTPNPATDGIRHVGSAYPVCRLEYAWPNVMDEDLPGGLLASLASGPRAGWMGTIDIPWRVRGHGQAYVTSTNLPESSALLQACGLSEVVAANVADYTPVDTGHKSCSIWVYAAKHLIKLAGCRGSFVWSISAGQPSICTFRMQGTVLSVGDLATIPTIGIQNIVPPPARAMTATIGAIAIETPSIEIDLGADVQRMDGVGNIDAITEFAIGGFKPTATIQGRTTVLSTYNPYFDAATPTARALLVTLGGTTYNKMKLVNTNAEVLSPEPVADNIATAWRLTYRLRDAIFRYD